jgi:mRNA-degrading endonuclease RelE of RelBE toxin-antitoxin system
LRPLSKRIPPDELRGTPEFSQFFTHLDKNGETYKRIKNCLDALREDICAGTKVQKDRFPKYYIEKYGITNLYRKEIGDCRLSYTVIAENSKKIVCVLEYFPTHKEYNERFGYRS